MLSPIFENRFKKDIKRLQKRGKDMKKLKIVIDKLLENQELEPKYKDHALTGNWKGYRDCHIESDWLLIYKISETHLFLARSGSHSDLFNRAIACLIALVGCVNNAPTQRSRCSAAISVPKGGYKYTNCA